MRHLSDFSPFKVDICVQQRRRGEAFIALITGFAENDFFKNEKISEISSEGNSNVTAQKYNEEVSIDGGLNQLHIGETTKDAFRIHVCLFVRFAVKCHLNS